MPDLTNRTVAVFGALRSGTTLLRIMLHGNSKLVCPGEMDFLLDHLSQGADGPFYEAEHLERDRVYRAHEEKYAHTPLEALTPNAFLERIAPEGKVGVLMLHRHPDRLLDLYPDMKIIHMVRDPRDVARSSIGMGWAGTVYHGADHWIKTESQWNSVVHCLKPEQVLLLRYEDLIREPKETLSKVCDFCGVSFEDGMLDYENRTTYSKPDVSLTEQWRRKQSPEELSMVEHKLGGLLGDTGYAPSGHAPHAPSFVEKLRLTYANKTSIWKHRIERFGLVDPLIVSVATKLNAPSLSRSAQRRIDEKHVKYLK